MTAGRNVTIWCDGRGCHAWTAGDASIARDARKTAKHEGWAVGLPGGKDLCPNCRTKS